MASLDYFSRFRITLKRYRDRSSVRIRRFVSRGWGYPFIYAFLILLATSAVCLASGWTFVVDKDLAIGSGFLLSEGSSIIVAELIADIAYFVLVIGVILELAFLTKKRSGGGVIQ